MKTIVISGMPGAGNTTIGKLLAKQLNIEFFSAGKFFKSHSGNKKETQAALQVLNTKKGSSKKFHQSIEQVQEKLARQGDIVIESKLGIQFLKDYAFTVWLKGSSKVRAKRYAKKDNMPMEKARKMLLKKEEKERQIWEKMYGFDYFEQEKEADLVIDTSNKTPREIVEKIIQKLV